MKYYLLYCNSSSIKEIKGYSKLLNMEINETNLKDIVSFTNKFSNDVELQEFLFYNGLIDSLDGYVKIGYYKNSNLQLLPYGVSYKRDAKFFNLERLSNFYISHLTDEVFMSAFINTYYNRLKYVPYFSVELNRIYTNYHKFLNTHILPINSQTAMSDFIVSYSIKKTKNGFSSEFSRIRELAMFVIDYISKNNLREKKIEVSDDDIEEIKDQISHYNKLLQDENLDEDIRISYETAIKNLNHSLELISYSKGGRKK